MNTQCEVANAQPTHFEDPPFPPPYSRSTNNPICLTSRVYKSPNPNHDRRALICVVTIKHTTCRSISRVGKQLYNTRGTSHTKMKMTQHHNEANREME